MDLDLKIIQSKHFEKGSEAKKFERLLLSKKKIRVDCVEKFDGCRELFNQNPLQYAEENNLIPETQMVQSRLVDF